MSVPVRKKKMEIFNGGSVFKLKGNLCRRNNSKQIKKCGFLCMQIDLYFHGKTSRQKYCLRHTTFAKLISWSDLLGLYSSSPWSFPQHSPSFINFTLWLRSLSQCLYHVGHLAIGPQTETPQRWRWSMKVADRRRGLHCVLYFFRQFSLSYPFFFRYSKGLEFTYYEKILQH